MKLVCISDQDDQGLSDVFYTITIENPHQAFIDRWNSIANTSPLKPIVAEGKENVCIGSIYDEDLDLFTLGEGYDSKDARSLDSKNAAFLVNNIVCGIIGMPQVGPRSEYLQAAFSGFVTVKILEDDSEVSPGWIWVAGEGAVS